MKEEVETLRLCARLSVQCSQWNSCYGFSLFQRWFPLHSNNSLVVAAPALFFPYRNTHSVDTYDMGVCRWNCVAWVCTACPCTALKSADNMIYFDGLKINTCCPFSDIPIFPCRWLILCSVRKWWHLIENLKTTLPTQLSREKSII